MHNKILNETDFNLLYQQKQALVAALYDHEFIEPDVLEGLINFLDVIGDWAEREGKFKYPEHTEPDEDMLRKELYAMKNHLENLFSHNSTPLAPDNLRKALNNLSFSYNDNTILNPFIDESGRFEVDPVSHYGTQNIEVYTNKAKSVIKEFYHWANSISGPVETAIIANRLQEQFFSKEEKHNHPSLDSLISKAKSIAAEGEALAEALEKHKDIPTIDR